MSRTASNLDLSDKSSNQLDSLPSRSLEKRGHKDDHGIDHEREDKQCWREYPQASQKIGIFHLDKHRTPPSLNHSMSQKFLIVATNITRKS